MKISNWLKANLYTLVTFARVTKDYTDVFVKEPDVRREAKMTMNQLSNSLQRFLQGVRAAVNGEDAKKRFDAEWQKDYLAWASIFDSLVAMNEEQIQGVERFCLAILAGEVEVKFTEEEDDLLPKCPGCGTKNQVKHIGANNYHSVCCNKFFVHG